MSKVFIDGLPDLSREAVSSFFIAFGEILDVQVDGHIAIIEFEEEDDAKAAIDNMHDTEIYGRVIAVSKATQGHTFAVQGQVPVWEQEGFEAYTTKEVPPVGPIAK